MEQPFKIYYKSKILNLRCETIYQSDQMYRVKVWGKNRHIVLQNNIPYLEATGKKGKVKWKLIEGEMYSDELLSAIIKELERRWKQQNSNSQVY